ncbi:hypothetical protein C8R44DRAFT_990426 [Mycena epipterygia]|nr:hypothetical protein C8R44DRAFT_990426 [Mycena epipterygia]
MDVRAGGGHEQDDADASPRSDLALSLPDPRLQKSYGPSGRVLRLGACGVHIWAARHPCVLRQRPASYVPALAAKGCSFRSSPTWGGALRPRRCVVHPASSVPHPALAPRVRLRAPDLGGHGRRQGEMQGQYLGAGNIGSAQSRSRSANGLRLGSARVDARTARLRSPEDLAPGGGSGTKKWGSMREKVFTHVFPRAPPCPTRVVDVTRILHSALEPAHAHAPEQDLDHEVHAAPTSRTAYNAYARCPRLLNRDAWADPPTCLAWRELGHDQDEHHPSVAPPPRRLPRAARARRGRTCSCPRLHSYPRSICMPGVSWVS